MPGHPVDKEENVAAFLLHYRLECVDQGRREKPGTFRQRKQTKRKNAIDALAKAGHHEGPFRIARPAIFGLRGQADAVGLDEIGKNLLVSSFLKAVELDRLLQQRVGNFLTVAENAQARLALGLHCDVPYRQADEAVARLEVELRPIDNR